ncbi:MAG: dTDP-4-dehydrorhamnose reductase [Acidobacteria bacterium]|nr:dTDP-4-dehydrorhamnose reductase [Acidobacteriota bacterium]
MRALVVGSEGQLGRELVSVLADDVVWAGDRAEIDVTDAGAVASLVDGVSPDVIFNATAYNKVDQAEAEPEVALEVNALAPRWLALAARERGALLVHFSTDYVFDGRASRPYQEEDCPRPLGAYGVSKLTGEQLVMAAGGEHLVIRTSGVLGRGGSEQKGGSFADRILARAREGKPLRVVADQTFAPTCAVDLAVASVALVGTDARGLVHVTNAGSCSWHELATATLARAGIDVAVEAIGAAELALPARRPAYSVLDTSRYRALGLPALRPWREALADCVPLRVGGD